MSIARRTAEIFREKGPIGILEQSARKLAYWKRVYSFRPHYTVKEIAGFKITVPIRTLFNQSAIEKRVRWPELDWVCAHLLRDGDTAFDCGANIGFTSTVFAKSVGPHGRVHAFEPVRSNISIFHETIRCNDVQNVTLHETAVGAANGHCEITDSPNGIVGKADARTTLHVSVCRLDDFVTTAVPDFVKIDVEGHELEVLNGASRLLAHRPNLDVEVHPIYHGHCERFVQDVFEKVCDAGYDVFVQETVDGEITAYCSTQHTPARLARQDVFHLYAKRRS